MSVNPTIESLTKAIRAIPTGPRWDAGHALSLFAHAAVLGTTQRAQQGYRDLIHAKSYPPMKEALDGRLFPEAQSDGHQTCQPRLYGRRRRSFTL